MPNDNRPEPPRLLTSAEVASIFGVDTKTVIRWANTGKLNAVKTPGGRYRYHQAHIYAYLRDEEQ
jgi:excisionase family DNA binding protein